MKFLLLAALACLVTASEEPLQFSGNFNTIYIASKNVRVTEENSQVRMLMREVKFFKNYTLMSMTFYVRTHGKCQLHTLWADKSPYNFCLFTSIFNLVKCYRNSPRGYIVGTWVVRDAILHFPEIYTYPPPDGGRSRQPSKFYIILKFVSNTTILMEANFWNNLGNIQTLTAALAKGTNITEEMWKDYVKLTHNKIIPIENIKNVYEADTCRKLE
ncbi:uncharacterized protein LOC121137281 [Mesocricetus auratus]|uniref:Uncharacterized protein LOC121137281 n=1 Tax=Mesocricetus auratus TaxID=10036 RepID=A0ABM2X1U7_MESAU|nr:uncharacterized protein LOC121137281 [Mesocricetus auratus]